MFFAFLLKEAHRRYKYCFRSQKIPTFSILDILFNTIHNTQHILSHSSPYDFVELHFLQALQILLAYKNMFSFVNPQFYIFNILGSYISAKDNQFTILKFDRFESVQNIFIVKQFFYIFSAVMNFVKIKTQPHFYHITLDLSRS